MKVLALFRDILEVKNLRERIGYTINFAILYRLGTFVLLPGLDPTQLNPNNSVFLSLLDSLLGGSLTTFSIFALGITPYISASLMVQIASSALPHFQRLKKEGAAGRLRLSQYTRYLALFMSALQAVPYLITAANRQADHLLFSRYYFYPLSLLFLVTSTAFCMWLADRITERGIANGTSVLIMVGVLSKLPGAIVREYQNTASKLLLLVGEFVILIAIIVAVIAFFQGTRRIPLQYARQMEGGGALGGARQYIPLKMNSSGVMPIIFANMFLSAILFVANLLKKKSEVASSIGKALSDQNGWTFNTLEALLVFVATFLCVAFFMNPTEMAENLKRNNGFIPGVKPGKPTAAYIDQIVSRITLPGALFLGVTCLLPPLSYYCGVSSEFSKFYGGSSMLIVVGVVLEVVQQIESHLFNRYYDKMMHSSQMLPDLE